MRQSIEKHVNTLDYAVSSLWRRRLKNTSIILVFTAVIFLLASFQMVASSLAKIAEEALRLSPEITIQKMQAGRQIPIPVNYSEKAGEIFGIHGIAPRVWGYYFDETSGANLTVLGLLAERMSQIREESFLEKRGADPHREYGNVIVGRSVDKVLRLDGRDIFSLFRPDLSLKPFQIGGVFDEDMDVLAYDTILMNIEDARDLFAMDADMATDLLVTVTNPTEIETIARKIAHLMPDTRIVTRPQILKTYQVVFSWRGGFASVCLLSALAAFAILAWDKASGLSPEERKEVGILKILGWETTDILTVRFWEGFLVSSLSFILGCTAAFIHVTFFEAVLFRPVLMGWSVISPPLRLIPHVGVPEFLLIFCFTVVPYLAATVIPAWRCAIVPADTVLR